MPKRSRSKYNWPTIKQVYIIGKLNPETGASEDYTYNELQLNLFANSYGFISISGGSTLLLNLFQKSTLTYLYNSSDLRQKFWENENGIKNIKNYYYMMNPNVIPFIDRDCKEMNNNNYGRFLTKIKEVF